MDRNQKISKSPNNYHEASSASNALIEKKKQRCLRNDPTTDNAAHSNNDRYGFTDVCHQHAQPPLVDPEEQHEPNI